MRNIFLLVVVVGAVFLAIGVVVLGAFPPERRPHPVEKVLPNERFQGH